MIPDDIHAQADDIVDVEEMHGFYAACFDDLEWVAAIGRHLLDDHDLNDHERVQMVRTVTEATLERVRLLEFYL